MSHAEGGGRPAPMSSSRVVIDCDLQLAAVTARRFRRLQQRHPAWAAKCERANLGLAFEWLALIAVTYLLVYGLCPWWIKAVLLVPWCFYAALAIDNVVHYSNHWPLFKWNPLNVAWRSLGVFVFWYPLEIKYRHAHHHRCYHVEAESHQRLRALASRPLGERVCGFLAYLVRDTFASNWSFLPWAPLPGYIRRLRRQNAYHYWEIVVTRWMGLAWPAVLLALNWKLTLLVWVPTVFVFGPFASVLMNITDHLPGDLYHPFRQATYFEPASRAERVLSAINHHTAATHLTHHLFPHVHFAHLPRLQKRLLRLYRRHESPLSFLINTTIVGNPVAVLRLLSRIVLQGLKPEHLNGRSALTKGQAGRYGSRHAQCREAPRP